MSIQLLALARVYPSKLSKQYEVLDIPAGRTIEEWLRSQAPAYRPLVNPPLTVQINGHQIPACFWGSQVIAAGDDVVVVSEPGEPMTIAYAVIAVISAAYSIYMANQIPNNYQTTTPRGSSIYDVNAQGNQPRLMAVIPEQFGTHKAYPDLKAEPHYYYADGYRWLNLLLSQGVGEFDRPLTELYIGNTPVTDYGNDIQLLIASPGESIASHPAHRCMYSSPEIGSTSSGTGQQLEGVLALASATEGNLIATLRGSIVTMQRDVIISTGHDSSITIKQAVTPEWPAGHHITMTGTAKSAVLFSGNVDLVDMGDDGAGTEYPDEIHNPFGWDGFTVGKSIRLLGGGDNAGNYVVRTISGTAMTLSDGYGSPVTWITPAIGVAVSIVEAWSNDGTYRIEDIGTGTMTLKMVDPVTMNDIAGWTHFIGSDEAGTITLSAPSLSLAIVEQDLIPKSVGPIRANPINHIGTDYEIDLRMPNGLGYLNDNGNFSERSVTVRIEYRAAGSDDVWQYIDHTFTAATNIEQVETVPLFLPEGAYEFRLSNQTPTKDDTKLLDRVDWVGLKTMIAAPTSYADETIICLSVRGSDTLSAASENKISTIWTRKLPVPDGNGGWTSEPEPTNSIAAAVRYIIHDVGHSDLQIGMDELLSLHALWTARGDEFAARFDDDSTMLDAIKRVLQSGMSEPTLRYGQITPVRRSQRSVPEQMYQPQNMASPGIEINVSLFDQDEPDGVEVEYFSRKTWKSETVLALLPGELGINPEKLRAYGVTDRTQAWRIGMRRRRQLRYSRLSGEFKTEMDGFCSNYQGFVAVGIDYPGLTQTGRLTSANGLLVTTDQPITTAIGLSANMLLRRQDGSASGPYDVTVLDEHTLQLDRELDFEPCFDSRMEPPLYQLGRWLNCWVTDIKPSGTDAVTLSVANYDIREFEDDERYPSYDSQPKSLSDPG